MLPGHGRSRAPMRYGLGIQFEDRPDDSVLGRLVEIHRLDQPSPFRLPARAGIPLRGLSHFARRRARIGPVSRRAESGTHLHHQISVLLGSGTRANPKPPSSPTKIGKAQASEEAIFLDSFEKHLLLADQSYQSS